MTETVDIKTEPEFDVYEHQQCNELQKKRKIEQLSPQYSSPEASTSVLSEELDGIDLLFLSYAKTLKTFSKRRQISVKTKISQILTEAEIDEIDLQD